MRRLNLFSADGMFRRLFNFRDDNAKGRIVMLILTVYTAVFNCINTGVFYTGFLSANDINIVNVGIISFLPFLAGICSIFSPFILERFERRRVILAVARILYYFFSLFASTIMPVFVSDPSLKILLFCIFVFVANLINALFVSTGYSAWHINFIPDNVRVNYFSVVQIISSAISSLFFLVSTVLTDRIGDISKQGPMFSIIRYVTFGFAVVETIILLLPKEYEYKKTVRTNLKNLFLVPLKNKGFMNMMLIIFAWSFIQYAAATPVDYYLINNIGVKYTFIAVINLLYSVFLVVFAPMWRKITYKHGWITVFGLTAVVQGVTTLLYSFITNNNYVVLMLVVRLSQHLIGVGLNLTYANLCYLRMPDEDRTSYISFHTFFASIAMFIGLLCGTAFVGVTENFGINILGHVFYNVPLLMVFQGVGQLLIGLVSYLKRKKLEPGRYYS